MNHFEGRLDNKPVQKPAPFQIPADWHSEPVQDPDAIPAFYGERVKV